jgi:hypothetical protein
MNKTFALIAALSFCLSSSPAVAQSKLDKSRVEIKCLVAPEKIGEISEKLGLSSKAPLLRTICFFDTDSLALFQHDPKLILRSRFDSADEADTTVKVRGGKAKGNGVECEFDKVLGKERTESCSITDEKQTVPEIQVANGGKHVKKIFSKNQEELAEDIFGKMNWDKLRPYGPVEGVRVWKKIEAPGCPPLTVERWDLPARSSKPARTLFEVSAKVPLAEEAQTAKAIADSLGVSEDQSNESETKTRIVLEHFAEHSP